MNPQLSQKIAVDCDGVLAKTVEALLTHHNYQFAGKPLQYEGVLHHNFHEIPGFEHATRDQAFEIFQNFLLDPLLHKTIDPIEHALETMYYLKDQGHSLYLVTARGPSLEKVTLDWLSQNYPDVFSDAYFINHTLKDKEVTKSSICADIGAGVIIEDAVHNAIDCAMNDIKVFLVERPWNKERNHNNQSYPNIHPVSSWQEIG